MKAVVLVGGEATRLRPLTCNLPKALVPLANEPFLSRFITYLRSHGIHEIVLAVASDHTRLEQSLGDGRRLGVRIIYSPESRPLGTAGAIKNAEKYIDGRFLACNGDMLTGIDLTDMVRFHHEKRALITIALTPVDNPTAYGTVETDSEQRVKRFVEKPPVSQVTTNMINAGIYVMEPSVLADIPPDTFSMVERDVFPRLVTTGKPVYAYASPAYWIDIGTPEKYLAANHLLVSGDITAGLPYDFKQGDVMIQGHATIHPGARLNGRILVGDGCVIGNRARIIGPTVLGHNCLIDDGATVEGAVLWDGVKIGRGAVLRRCIIGSESVIGERCQVLEYCVVGSHVHLGPGNRLGQGRRIWPDQVIPSETILSC
ncbi:MAG: NDP-sugar synthase [Dehalococcoidia bacterium]|nr:NDP-sugar synthase [Dehalococcoidia bacterium]